MSLLELKEIIKNELNKKNHFDFKKISVAFPFFDENEIYSVLESLLDLKISQGEKTKLFENTFAKYHGMNAGIAVNSGSSANLVAFSSLMELNKLKKGDEVIVPATTFATVVSPLYQLGLVPVYIDIEDKNWNIDSKLIEQAISPKTKAIMPVHTLGFPAEMNLINQIAKKYNLLVIEDCCEAHGAKYKNHVVGSLSDISTFSFFVAHNITTGEGGMILTNNSEFEISMRSIREFGRLLNYNSRFTSSGKMKNYDSRYMFMKLGYNLRMSDIASSMGIEQIKKLDGINEIRRLNAKYLSNILKKFNNHVYIPETSSDNLCAYYGYPFLVKNNKLRNKFASYLEENNIETRSIMGGCLPDQPAFENQVHRISGELINSKRIKDGAIFIGIHSALNKKNLDYIADKFDTFFANNN